MHKASSIFERRMNMKIHHQFERDGYMLLASRLPKAGDMPGISMFSLYAKAGRGLKAVALCKPASVIRRLVKAEAV
jgi:hypothetical protein